MALVLNTTLKSDGKVFEEGTPYSKLKKSDKELAKELGLLVNEEEEVPDAEEAEEEAEEEEDESEEETEEG